MKHEVAMNVMLVSAVTSAVVGSVVTFFLMKAQQPTTQDRIKDFYGTENAVYVSPHTLRKRMDKGETNYILVDVRSLEEYEKAHIVGAISIPAYKDPNTSISLDTEKEEKERIIGAFNNVGNEKDIVVYCYSTPCMTGRKIGKLLSEHDIYVKHLGIGWNEWRYSWNLWNHDGETPTDVNNYISSGKDPGKPTIKDTFSPCKVGELGC